MPSTRVSALDVGRSSVVGGEAGTRGSLLVALANAAAGVGGGQVDGQQQQPTGRKSSPSNVLAATLTVPHGSPGALHADLNEVAGVSGGRGSMLERPPVAVESLPVRQYLELMVVPALLPALTTVVTERPDRPVEFLAHWLLENAHKYNDPASPTDFATTVALLGGGGAMS